MPDIIPDDNWDTWLNSLVRMLDKYEKKLDVVTFLGQIKQKIDDCSRTYTAIWIIEMLFQSAVKLKDDVGDEFEADVNQIKKSWDVLYAPYKQQRMQLICSECINFFYSEFEDASKVIKREKVDKMAGSSTEKWNQVSKICHEKGLSSDEKYQLFQQKLMNEMVKY